jgi:hypothetical protein
MDLFLFAELLAHSFMYHFGHFQELLTRNSSIQRLPALPDRVQIPVNNYALEDISTC